MNIGFSPTQISQSIPDFPGAPGGIYSPKNAHKAKPADFGDLLLRKFEVPAEVTLDAPMEIGGVGSFGRSGSAGQSGNLVGDFIRAVDAKQHYAADTRTAFLAGESGNLHQTMIASQEASVSFSLMVEMRNKVLEAYQELMRIQI